MENEDPNFITMEYDDGVVCFGPVTESQLERTRRLPRHTIVPPELSLSFEDKDDEDKDDDDNDEINVNITKSINHLGNNEETGTNELKQSFTEDSLSVFSSPCVTGTIPYEKLIDTEVINRYIRMESSDESSSEEQDQEKSVFEDNDASSCAHLNITEVMEQNTSNEPNKLTNVDNVCTLKPCSQEEDKDLSIYSEMELEDIAEDSIVADKYSVTPGKQRLFDLRPAKSPFRSNTFVASAPYMDRIDETVTPEILECPKIKVHDISYDLLKTKENLDVTSVTGIQSVQKLEFASPKFIDDTQNTFDQVMESNAMEVDMQSSNTIILSKNFDNSECNFSTNKESIKIDNNINITQLKCDAEKSMDGSNSTFLNESLVDLDNTKLNYVSDMNNVFYNTAKTINVSSMNKSIDFNESNKMANSSDVTDQIFGIENSSSNHDVVNNHEIIHDYEDEKLGMEVQTKLDDSICTNNISTIINSTNLNKTLDGSNTIENTLNVTEQIFETENSNMSSNFNVSNGDVENDNADDTSIMEVENKSQNAIVDNKLNDSVNTNNLSTINNSVNLNNTLDKSNTIEKTLNVIEHEMENSNTSNFNGVNEDVENDNDDDTSIMEVEIKSRDAIVDNKLDDSVNTNNLSTIGNSVNLNNTLDKSNTINNTLNVTEQKFEMEKSITFSNFNGVNVDVENDNGDEKSIMEVEIKTCDAIVDNKLDDSLSTNNLSTINNSDNLNKTLDKSNKIENTLNVAAQQFEMEKSNISFNFDGVNVDAENDNGDEKSIMEVEIKSHDSIVDDKMEDSVYTNNLSTINNSENLTKTLDKSNKIENTLIVTAQKFEVEKSNISFNPIVVNDDVTSIMEVEIKSHDSIVDYKLDHSLSTNLSTVNNSVDLIETLDESNKIINTLNVTEKIFEMEKSNISSNFNVFNVDVENDNGDEKSLMEVKIKSHDAIVDNKLDDSVNTNNLSTIGNSVNLNKTWDQSNTIENTLNVTEEHFDMEKSKTSSNFNGVNVDVENYNGDEKSIMEVEIKSHDAIVDNKLDDSVSTNLSTVNNSVELIKTLDESNKINNTLNVTEQICDMENSNIFSNLSYNVVNVDVENDNGDEKSVQCMPNISISTLNSKTTLQLGEFDNQLTDKKNTEISYFENLKNSDTNEFSVASDKTKEFSHATRQYLDFEQTVYELCHNISSASCNNTQLNESINYDNQTQENISMMENSLHSETLYDVEVDKNISDNNVLKSNLSVIIENRTLEESSIDIVEKNCSNYICDNSVHESVVDENNDTEMLDNSIKQNIRQSIVSKVVGPLLNGAPEIILGSEKSHQSSIEQDQNLLPNCDNQQLNLTKQFEIQTPKAQKLIDFSIVQQTPQSQKKKQKLFNFSIVDQTPTSKSMHQTCVDEKFVKQDILIDFSSVNQTGNLEEMSSNISAVSAPDIELLIDDTIKTNSSNLSNSTFNQTVTETNLNQSANLCEIKKETNISSFSKGIDKIELFEVSKQNEKQDEPDLSLTTSEYYKPESKCLSDNTLNLNSNNYSNERAIVDFSIVEQPRSQTSKLENCENVKPIASDCNILNLMEMSVANPKYNEQISILSDKTVTAITSGKDFEITRDICSDEINNSVSNFGEFKLTHNTELLSDIQMDDVSLLMESSEKSSVSESFHSIELDHVHDDNKRKMDDDQEYQGIEKKMKVECDEPKTPMSMLYKIRNMFKSSERRQLHWASSSKENVNKFEENKDNSIRIKSSNIVKSKIPCKVTDKSMTKNDELNVSSLLNNSVKPKKTIPRFTGLPVLSDLSNSSKTKCPESHNPSKF